MSLLALSVLILAQTASPPPAESAAAAPKPVKICREGQRSLGTHRRTGRVCKTAEDWEADKTDRSYIPSMTVNRRQDIPFEGNRPPPCC